MAFWWKNLSVTELLSLHGRGFAFPRRFLSIPPKPKRKQRFRHFPSTQNHLLPSCSGIHLLLQPKGVSKP